MEQQFRAPTWMIWMGCSNSGGTTPNSDGPHRATWGCWWTGPCEGFYHNQLLWLQRNAAVLREPPTKRKHPRHGGTAKFERSGVIQYNLTNRAGNEHSWSTGARNILIWGDDAVCHFLGLITTLARGMLVCLPSFSFRRVLAMKLASFPSHSRRLPGLAASRRWINLRVDPGCHRKSQLEIPRPTHFSVFFFRR